MIGLSFNLLFKAFKGKNSQLVCGLLFDERLLPEDSLLFGVSNFTIFSPLMIFSISIPLIDSNSSNALATLCKSSACFKFCCKEIWF